MKKLLSILGSASLIISAPINMVACGGSKRPDINDEYDFEKLLNELKSLANDIFTTKLDSDFNGLYFLTLDKAKAEWGKKFDFEKLCSYVETKDEYEVKPQSELFKQMNDYFQGKRTMDRIKEQAQKDIVGNVNFKVLLNKNKNPFSAPLKLESATILSRNRTKGDRVISIEYKLTTKLELVDPSGSVFYETLTYKASSTIFEKDEVSNAFNAISNKYQTIVADDKYSNRYTFESNDGGDDDYNKTKSNFSKFENIFQTEMTKEMLSGINIADRFSFSIKDASYSYTQRIHFEAPMYDGTKRDYWNNEKSVVAMNKKAAIVEGGQKVDDLVKFMTEDNSSSSYLAQYYYSVPEEILKKYPDSSRYINSWTIFDKFANGPGAAPIRDKANEKNIHFDTNIEDPDQRRVIKIYPTYVSGIKVNYRFEQGEDFTLDLPSNFFLNKQLTTFANTKEFHKQYIKANILFLRELYGFGGKTASSSSRDLDYTLQIKRPKNYTKELEPGELYSLPEFIDLAVEEAIKNATVRYPEINFSDYINGYDFINKVNYFKINRSGYMFLYNDNKEFVPRNELDLSWTKRISSVVGTFDYGSTFFDIGYQVDTINTDYSSEKTPWKMFNY